MIISLENKKIKLLNKLKQKKFRQNEKKFFVEGEHLVQMALEHQQALCVFLTEQYYINEAQELYKDSQYLGKITTTYEYIAPEIAHKIKETKTSQGIFAICSMKQNVFDQSNIIIFDGVRDPGNVGTIIRTAQAFDVHNFYFTNDSVDVYNDKVIRASQGAVFLSNFLFEAEDKLILDELAKSHQVFLLDLLGENIHDVTRKHKTPYAIIAGNEGEGIHEERWQNLSLTKVLIPINDAIESLNVGIATGIMLYHLSDKK